MATAACNAGDAFAQLAPEDGGHFGASVLAERLGIESFAFPMRGDLIDVERTARLVEQQPRLRLVLVQPSHSRRPQPIEELAAALPPRGDHRRRRQPHRRFDLGGRLPELFVGRSKIMLNTHKTLPGPNKGVIAFADRHHRVAERRRDALRPAPGRTAILSAFPDWSLLSRNSRRLG